MWLLMIYSRVECSITYQRYITAVWIVSDWYTLFCKPPKRIFSAEIYFDKLKQLSNSIHITPMASCVHATNNFAVNTKYQRQCFFNLPPTPYHSLSVCNCKVLCYLMIGYSCSTGNLRGLRELNLLSTVIMIYLKYSINDFLWNVIIHPCAYSTFINIHSSPCTTHLVLSILHIMFLSMKSVCLSVLLKKNVKVVLLSSYSIDLLLYWQKLTVLQNETLPFCS